ncbi:hybrid sensor histidine kinase/response regulator transcription factor [Dyadobacter bucti]|uniref:hybrid sensor histidine kinase/response regulator transcription factor n=1 Tax=Dyadobacter bucti TaxID=2572203 RepID=UPI003F7191AC
MKSFEFRIFLVFIFSPLFPECRSQGTFHHLTTNEGLSHSTVMDIVQDHRGFMWLATADGLNRYDGERFRNFRRSASDTNTLSNNYVNCLLEDRHRQLWAGTNNGGVNVLKEAGEKVLRLTHCEDGSDISSARVTDIALDKSGFIWAATAGNGLLKINPVSYKVRQINTANSALMSNHIIKICFDTDGKLWLADIDGSLQRLDPDGQISVRPFLTKTASSVPIYVMTIKCDRNGRVWVGTKGSGLFRCERRETVLKAVFFRPGTIEGVNNARSLYEDQDGVFWLGTDDGVIVSEDPDFRVVRQLRHDPAQMGSLSTHATVSVRGDRQGNIWVGTWEGGLNVLFKHPDTFQTFTYLPGQPGGLLAQAVSAVAADDRGGIWVGSTQGLTFIDKTNSYIKHFQHQPENPRSIPGNDITQLYFLSLDALLVNIWNKGTVLINPKTGQVRKRLPTLELGSFSVVNSGTTGDVRIFTEYGVAWLLDRTSGDIRPGHALPILINRLTSVAETADGTLWVGTPDKGLVEIPPGTGSLKHHQPDRKPGALYSEHITGLFEDRNRNLWVGTMSGLHRYDRQSRRFTLLDMDSGLANDAIMSIGQDKKGYLWIATNDGLCRLSESGKVLNTYRRADGLAGNDFTRNAFTQSADKTLLWGGKHGLTSYRQSEQEKVDLPIPVFLTDLKLFNRTVHPGAAGSPLAHALMETGALELRYEQSVFTFDFSAVLYRAHRNVRYAYKLDGFEDDWNYLGAQHSATYTNQNPGTYRFRVKASLTDDFTNSPETVLTLTILPPWYRTTWAYAAYALIALLLLAVLRHLIQIRENYKTEIRAEHLETEKARELDRIRAGFFTNISHEFRTPLTLIITPLEQFMSDSASGHWRRQFQSMHRNANRLLRLINQLLDLTKLESGSFSPEVSKQDVGLVRQVAQSFLPQAVKQGIELRMDTVGDGQAVWFDQDIVEKILYNLLANALKFTATGGSITVRSQLVNSGVTSSDRTTRLLLEVEDTGIGISAENARHIFERFYQVDGKNGNKKTGSGIGLALTRELVELHRGSISVESQLGIGTVFMVELPVYQEAFPAAWLSRRSEGLPKILLSQDTEADSYLIDTSTDSSGRDSLPLVLVAEDDDDLRQYLADCLGGSYQVHTTTNGRQALAFAQTEIPDLIVSDWLMPDMDGVQLCHALKTDERTSHVPVLILTSRSSNESKVEGLDAGADDYVTKPFNLEVLRSRVRNLIQSRHRLREKYSRVLTLQSAPIATEAVEEVFLHKVLEIIQAHLDDPELDVALIEGEMGLSNTQLYRKLKALTGKGGNELIRNVRLQRAAQLLKATDRQIAEIAYDVGFNDPNYFNRVFKKEFGVSPGEWSKMKHEA